MAAEVSIREEKSGNALKNILLFIVFLAIGVAIGFFGTKKYMENKNKETETPVIDEGPEDITDVDEYKDLINKLHSYVDGYSFFYTTKGVQASTMSNADRLYLLYDRMANDNELVDSTLTATNGVSNCIGQFALDAGTNTCVVKKIDRNKMSEKNKSVFDDDLLDTSVTFTNSLGKLCIVSEASYMCGTPLTTDGITGKLESKFTITKVTKQEGTIVIYDKGYLLDTRSNIMDPMDGHDKYYLHSTDSTEYYYELKNADNLSFKHTFVTKDRVNYYYVSSELVKE
jgi:hypothetical protein